MQDWREGKSILECHLYMFDNSVGCDVTFVAGETKERIAAHKYVLSCMSPVFQAMFMGSLASDDPEVSVPDCDPEVFKEFLRYLYGDIIEITDTNACHLLYLSKKYLVPNLIRKTITFLCIYLNDLNCLSIFQQANQFDEKDLEREAMKMICAEAEKILNSEEFLHLPANILSNIIGSNALEVGEEKVFEAVLRWANQKCVELGLDETPENQRSVLGDIIHLIRFPLMDTEYFVAKVLEMKLLTLEEGHELMRKMLQSLNVELKFINSRRIPENQNIRTCRRVDEVGASRGKWNHHGLTDAIRFTVNKNVILDGFEWFGPCNSTSTQYNVTYAVFDDDNSATLYEGHEEKRIGSGQIAQFEFGVPVRVCRGNMYTLSATTKGPIAKTFKSNWMSKVTIDDLVFNFFNSDKSTNGTRTDCGQIPGILFHL